jgi:hypothetical protein
LPLLGTRGGAYRLTALLSQLASAARFLEEKLELFHRDIKPANIVVSEDFRHPEALRLARHVAAGRQYLDFDESVGFRAEKAFVPPAPRSVRQVAVPMFLTMFGLVIAVLALLANNFRLAAILGALTVVMLLATLIEFAEMRGRHWARKAIEQSAGARPPEPQPLLPAAIGVQASQSVHIDDRDATPQGEFRVT